jgi:hypothetical protein
MHYIKKEWIKLQKFWGKNKIEVLEIKSFICQIKNSVEILFSRLNQTEDRLSRLEDKVAVLNMHLEIEKKTKAIRTRHVRPPEQY